MSGGVLRGPAHAQGVCPPDLVTVTLVLDAPGGGTISRAELERGVVLFFPPGVIYEGATPGGYRWSSVFLTRRDLDRLAVRTSKPLARLLGSRVLRAVVKDSELEGLVAAEGLAGVSRARSATGPMREEAAASLDAAWMRLLEHAWPRARSVRGRAADLRAEQTVHAASRFLRNHLTETVYAAEVAEAVGVPLRTLEHIFRRRLGTSPMAYLTWLRMAEARRRLRGWSGPPPRSITALAADVGFPHASRFAATYRATFGELPRETLARRADSERS